MPGRGLQRHPAPERVAPHVGLVEPEMVDERRDVVGHEAHLDGPVDVRGAPVALQVDRDDLVARGELRHHLGEHLARPEPAVQGNDRATGAMDFVVEVDAVDVCVIAGVRLHAPKDPTCARNSSISDVTPGYGCSPAYRARIYIDCDAYNP